jgi:hypothetical protein
VVKEYFARPKSGDWDVPDAKEFLARTVHESDEAIDIGLLDAAGNKLMARRRKNPVGFVRFRDAED